MRGLEWKRRGGQEAHRSSARHGFPCCESGFSQRVAVVSSVVKNGLLKLLAFFALTVLTIKTTLDTTKSWCWSLQFVPSVLLPPRIGHACCPYYIFSQPHAQFQTVGVNAACLPMSSHLMLRKLSIFFHLQDCFVRAAALLQRALHSTLGVPSPTVCSWSWRRLLQPGSGFGLPIRSRIEKGSVVYKFPRVRK